MPLVRPTLLFVTAAGLAGLAVLPAARTASPAALATSSVVLADRTASAAVVAPGREGKLARSRAVAAAAAAQVRAEQQAQADQRARDAQRASRSRALPPPLSPREIAQVLLAQWGWSGQFGCLDALWSRESGWRVDASNASSGAYGIPQALPGGKMSSAGWDWQTNAATQIRWGLGYIAASYGTPCGALAHSSSYGWY